MKKKMLAAAIALGLVCAASVASAESESPATHGFRIVPPGEKVGGQTQEYWAQKWWNWILNIAADVNPNAELPTAGDPTGGKYASIGNDGPVVFLPGTSSPGKVARTLTIPANRPLILPIINVENVAFPDTGTCPVPWTRECALGQISPGIDNATNLSFTIDGYTLLGQDVRQFRQTSSRLADLWINPDPNNVYAPFGKPDGVFGYYPARAVQDGFYVVLDHLSVGKHTIRTRGTFGSPFSGTFDVTSFVCVGVRTNVFGACHG